MFYTFYHQQKGGKRYPVKLRRCSTHSTINRMRGENYPVKWRRCSAHSTINRMRGKNYPVKWRGCSAHSTINRMLERTTQWNEGNVLHILPSTELWKELPSEIKGMFYTIYHQQNCGKSYPVKWRRCSTQSTINRIVERATQWN
jgi:hypothetical protein